jgi:hypothetical protein
VGCLLTSDVVAKEVRNAHKTRGMEWPIVREVKDIPIEGPRLRHASKDTRSPKNGVL